MQGALKRPACLSSRAQGTTEAHRLFVSGGIVASASKALYMSDFRNLG